MKTRKFLWALLPVAAVLLMTAGGGDDTDDVTPTPTPNPVTPGTENVVKSVPYTVTVNTGNITRTTVDNDDETLTFDSDDKLYVQNDGGTIYGCLTLKSEAGKTTATFAGTVNYTGSTPDASTALTATLVGSGNQLVTIADDKVQPVTYTNSVVCASMEEAVSKYSWIRGTGTYGGATFTLAQKTAFMKFNVTIQDGTAGDTEVPVKITLGTDTYDFSWNTTGSQFDAEISFVLPLADRTVIAGGASMCVANVGTDDESIRIGTGSDVTLEGGNVYPVTRTKDFVRLWPGGPVWATKNVGASSVTDYGDYYQWGEKEPVAAGENCGWNSNYKFWVSGAVSSGDVKFSKYVPTDQSTYWGVEGTTPDNNTQLDYGDEDDEGDDVAYTITPHGTWRMPTDGNFTSLVSNTTYAWTTVNSVVGGTFTGNTTGYTYKAIFLPAASYWGGTSPNDQGSRGHYWSSSLVTSTPWYSRMLYFDSATASMSDIASRCYGRPVRAIRTN